MTFERSHFCEETPKGSCCRWLTENKAKEVEE